MDSYRPPLAATAVHQPSTPPRSSPRATSPLCADFHLWDLRTGSDTQGVDPPPGFSSFDAGARVPPLVNLRAVLASDGAQLFSNGGMPYTASSPRSPSVTAVGDRAASGTVLSAEWPPASGDWPSFQAGEAAAWPRRPIWQGFKRRRRSTVARLVPPHFGPEAP